MTIHSSFLARSTVPVHRAVPAFGDSRTLAIAALISWLVTEALGAYMLSNWIRGSRRLPPDPGSAATPASLVFGHAVLAATGFVSWVSFLATNWSPLAWAAVGLLALAIGLGISTVTVWTPYPVRRAEPGEPASAPAPAVSTDAADNQDPVAAMTDELLARALSDDVLASKIVDGLLARMLADPGQPARRQRVDLAPLIPVAHGLLAIVTFLLTMLAATATI